LYAVLAQSAIYAGNHKLARSAAAEGLVIASRVGDEPALVRLNSLAALASVYLGDFPDAQQALQTAGALARQRGQDGELTMILVLSAQVVFYSRGDVASAKALLREAEALSTKGRSQWNNAMIEFGLARLTGILGDVERARALFRQSADSAQRLGNMRVVYSCHSELAHILRRHGELDEALRLYAEVLPQWNGLGHRSAVAHELECIAFILGKKGRPESAVTLLGAADALRGSIDANMTSPERVEYDQVILELHAALDEKKFGQSWLAGQSMSIDRAIELALQAAQIAA
jgi:tetratricopeptide (TPR) repeat protein